MFITINNPKLPPELCLFDFDNITQHGKTKPDPSLEAKQRSLYQVDPESVPQPAPQEQPVPVLPPGTGQIDLHLEDIHGVRLGLIGRTVPQGSLRHVQQFRHQHHDGEPERPI